MSNVVVLWHGLCKPFGFHSDAHAMNFSRKVHVKTANRAAAGVADTATSDHASMAEVLR